MILRATVAVDRLPWLRRLAASVIAVGTMSLTLYVAHVLVIVALPGEGVTPPQSASLELLLCASSGPPCSRRSGPASSAADRWSTCATKLAYRLR
ncbi:hypothetical protein ABZ379_37435 [Streptomyces canus]